MSKNMSLAKTNAPGEAPSAVATVVLIACMAVDSASSALLHFRHLWEALYAKASLRCCPLSGAFSHISHWIVDCDS
jgi:hypothetical protein